MRRRTVRSALSGLAVAATAALLAGCFSVEASFEIHDDGTVDLDFVTLVDTKQLEQFSGMLGEDAGDLGDLSGDALLQELTGGDDVCADLDGELSAYEVTSREIREGSKVGVGCKVSGIPVAEMKSLGDDDSTITIEHDAGGTRFNAVLAGVDELAGDPDETAEMTSMLGMDLDELFSIEFKVTAPGSLGENNASSTSGSTATWKITPDAEFVSGGDATLTAVWTPGGGGSSSSSSTLWIILAIVAAAVVAVVAVLLIKRSKSGPTPAVATAGAPLAAPAGATAPPTMPAPDTATAPPPPPPSSTPPPPPPTTPPPPPTS